MPRRKSGFEEAVEVEQNEEMEQMAENTMVKGTLELNLPSDFWGVLGAAKLTMQIEAEKDLFPDMVIGTLKHWRDHVLDKLYEIYVEDIEEALERAEERARRLTRARSEVVNEVRNSNGSSGSSKVVYTECARCGAPIKTPPNYTRTYDEYIEWLEEEFGEPVCWKCRQKSNRRRRSRR